MNSQKVNIPAKDLYFAVDFLKKFVAKLSKYFNINDNLINLKPDKQSLYSLIYSLKIIELKILKTYIKNNLANSFISLSKSPIGAPILFILKLDGSFHPYIDYQGLNNPIIQN